MLSRWRLLATWIWALFAGLPRIAAVRPEDASDDDTVGSHQGAISVQVSGAGRLLAASHGASAQLAVREEVLSLERSMDALSTAMEQMSELTKEGLEEDARALYESEGNVSVLSPPGYGLLQFMEHGERIVGSFTNNEVHSLVELLVQDKRGMKPKKGKVKREEGAPPEYDGNPGMSDGVWKIYVKFQELYKKMADVRHQVNAVASVVGLFAPDKVRDSCILKLIFILYMDEDEDDYPYIPRGCGLDNFLSSFGA